ncbi:RNA polymerase sigma factor [bacterium]|nr:RNA polymerase sigma factor [bacterium]
MDDEHQNQITDDELMARVAADDESALGELMLRWQRPIHRFVYRGVRDADIAEEIAQETFWRVWRARSNYRPEGKFSAFLFRTAARLCLDHYRRRPRPAIDDSETALALAPAPIAFQPDDQARRKQLAEALESSLAKLPINQRMAMQLGRLEGMSYQEIASILGCSVGAVEQLIFRARAALRVSLGEFINPGGAGSRKTVEKT